ncbi:MAG: hypothetical protein EAX95_10555 [Candidatus Thorarchaeota archaeon]|nr:hypothetical protein [Candidatus Thorarchaeota archaeon]
MEPISGKREREAISNACVVEARLDPFICGIGLELLVSTLQAMFGIKDEYPDTYVGNRLTEGNLCQKCPFLGCEHRSMMPYRAQDDKGGESD